MIAANDPFVMNAWKKSLGGDASVPLQSQSPQSPPIIPPKFPFRNFLYEGTEINNRFASWRIHKQNGSKQRDWTGTQPPFSGTDEANVSLQSLKYHPAVCK